MHRRRLTRTLPLLGAACVATNPRWDEPVVVGESAASSPADTSADETGDDTETTGDTDASGGASSTSAESSWTGASDTSTSVTIGADDSAPCGEGQSECDGDCKDTETNKKYCGESCLDCELLFGSDAECVEGRCQIDDDSGRGESG